MFFQKTYAYLRPLPSILHDISQQLEVPEIKTVGLSKVSNEANSFKVKQKQNSNILTPNTLPLVLDEQHNRKDEDKKKFVYFLFEFNIKLFIILQNKL